MHNASQTKISRKRQSKSLYPARSQSKSNNSRKGGGSETPLKRSGTRLETNRSEIELECPCCAHKLRLINGSLQDVYP